MSFGTTFFRFRLKHDLNKSVIDKNGFHYVFDMDEFHRLIDLTVVVSFKQTISTTHLQFFSFSLTISLLVISVIFGVISLFYEVHLLDKMRNKLLQIQESVSKDENTSKQGRVSVDKSYIVYEYVCLISSALALI